MTHYSADRPVAPQAHHCACGATFDTKHELWCHVGSAKDWSKGWFTLHYPIIERRLGREDRTPRAYPHD